MTLSESMGKEFAFPEHKAQKFSNVEIVEKYYSTDPGWKRWPGTHRNVFFWVTLANGYAVGMNENPSLGITFPMVKIKDN